jgi:hypothetical protein
MVGGDEKQNNSETTASLSSASASALSVDWDWECITWCCRHRPLDFFNCCLDSMIFILNYNFSVNQWEQQSAHFMPLFNQFQKKLLTLGRRLARKNSRGVATVIYVKKVLIWHISINNRNGIIVALL